MKFSIAIIALASMVMAGPPHPPKKECTPPQYACLPDARGWQVCNTEGFFVFAGNCPPKTVCRFYKPSLSPYCVPPNFQIP